MSDHNILLDQEGYLARYSDWSESVSHVFAKNIGLELTEAHWEIIHAMRSFYETFELSPAMRPFTKYVKQHLGQQKSSSLYLMSLFPGNGSPVKRIALLAGLPKPDNCL